MIHIITKTGITKGVTRVKVMNSGWVRYEKDGEMNHYPPHRVKMIKEVDPETIDNTHYEEPRVDSEVSYEAADNTF